MSCGHIISPEIDERQVVELLVNHYEFSRAQICEVVRLNGYDDKNFKIVTNIPKTHHAGDGAQAFVLKVTNLQDSQNIRMAKAQSDLLFFLDENGIKCPVPLKTKTGALHGMVDLPTGKHLFKLTNFFDGVVLSEIAQFIDEDLCYHFGQHVAQMDTLFKRFKSIAFKEHQTIWSLTEVPMLRPLLREFRDNDEHGLPVSLLDKFERIVDTFETNVLDQCDNFTPSIIHGDCNEQNVIVQSTNARDKRAYRIHAILDFGDANYSYTIYDVAITLTYLLITTLDLESAKHFLAGYRSIFELSDHELSVLPNCIYARIAQSIVLGAYASRYQPTNVMYIQISRDNALKLLDLMHPISNTQLINLWTSA